mgnify:CR=1 FL=1
MAVETIRTCDLCQLLGEDKVAAEVTAEVSLRDDRSPLDLCGEHHIFVSSLGTFQVPTTPPAPKKTAKKAAAKKPQRKSSTTRRVRGNTVISGPDLSPQAIREWADANGKKYPKSGPIPTELLVEYRKSVA